MEWSRGVEWCGVWSGVESTLNSCNLGRAFEMQLRNTTEMAIQFRPSNVDIKDAKKTRHKNPFGSLNINGISLTHGVGTIFK